MEAGQNGDSPRARLTLQREINVAARGLYDLCLLNTTKLRGSDHPSAPAHDVFPDLVGDNDDSLHRSMVGLPVPRSECVTIFHSNVVPEMTLQQLVLAMSGVLTITDDTPLVALGYTVLYLESTNSLPTLHVVHRLYVTSLWVAVKFGWDTRPSIRSFASIAGVQPAELRRMEAALLAGVRWKLLITADDVRATLRPITASVQRWNNNEVAAVFAPTWGSQQLRRGRALVDASSRAPSGGSSLTSDQQPQHHAAAKRRSSIATVPSNEMLPTAGASWSLSQSCGGDHEDGNLSLDKPPVTATARDVICLPHPGEVSSSEEEDDGYHHTTDSHTTTVST